MDHIDEILVRLTNECPDVQTLDEAWFAEPLEDLDSDLPAVMVYLAKEDALEPAQTLRPVQRVRYTYGVWLVSTRDQFKTQRAEISSALFGYQLSEDSDPIEYQGGSSRDIKGDLIWWLEFWSYDTHKRG
jgi:hypothetical protein